MSIIVKAKYKKGFFARKVNADVFMKTLAEVCKNENYDARLLRTGEDTYLMQMVHNGSVTFKISETLIQAEAVTSVAGPGFHAAVINALTKTAQAMNIVFDFEDATDYIYNKAFMHLQKQFVEDLRQSVEDLVSRCKESDIQTTQLVDWNAPFIPTNQKQIVTLLGSYSIEELEEYLNNDFEAFAKRYFMWYNEGKDALYRKQSALFALWNVYKWRRPISQDEANLVTSIARNLEMARMLDNDITLPNEAWQTICAHNGIPYLNLNEMATEDYSTLGYLRGDVIQLLPLDYRLRIRGAFSRINQENAIIFTDGPRQVVVHVVPEMQPGHITDPRTMLERVDVQEEINGYLYVGMWREDVTPNGEKVYSLNGFIQGLTSFVNVVISYRNEKDREWALNAFKSFETPAGQPLSFSMLDKQA